ncbi:F-box/LRR-repeat protein 10 isoform X2 [Ricinus communis]|uniref:F-box/LRR-repeat protein 10 isoform X2 n=1 Tax=Ricinus communis TaxID=3988 RepID=UPI00201AEC48|nr:F-box/LRR-repeat protein 10 isoform X2 [Ricinus communis]
MANVDGSEEEKVSESLDQLPAALIATVMTKLDVASICSFASTCKTFSACACHILTFIPNFQLSDIALPNELLRPLLPPNPYLNSLKIDCGRLDDSAIDLLIRPSLQELCLLNCADFSGKLLSEIGSKCGNLRYLYVGSVAEKRGRPIHISDLEELLTGCTQLEALTLMFDVSLFLRHNFTRVWALASEKLTSLEIGYISSVMVTELLTPSVGPHQSLNHIRPSILPGIQKLSLSVDYITDTMVGTISKGLMFLTHLDLRDTPLIEPRITFDLTNSGLQQINQYGKLRHLSLFRSQEFVITYFRRVNDLGILLMADNCASMESICLGGFCQVTDTGFKTILHSCSSLHRLRVSRGIHLTDLVFHDMSATSLCLSHVCLRWCNLLTNYAIKNLVANTHLKVLDLRDCKNLGDESLRAISTLFELKILLLDGSGISDSGLSNLRGRVISSLVSLSVRGCKRLTDKCISALFEGASKLELQELDISNLPNLSDNGILCLAKSRLPISALRMRQCPLIGDTSVMALASMQVDEDRGHGSSLRLLDIYNCGGITQLAFRWLKKPYFPRLRWLGVTGSVNRDIIDALARNRPFLHVACHAEELGIDQWDNSDSLYMHDYDEVDELEQWLLEGEFENNDEEMVDAEINQCLNHFSL